VGDPTGFAPCSKEVSVKRSLGLALVATLALSGCTAIQNLIPFPVAGTTPIVRQTGQWQNTTILLQKYKNAAFVEKATGKILPPDAAQTKKQSEVDLVAGDFEELAYAKGSLRYALYNHEDDAQPYVVERKFVEADFETLDKAIWDDKFFSLPEQNWDPKTRFPLFYLTYVQGDKGYKSSFTPSLTKLNKSGKIFSDYMDQFSGAAKTPKGVTQIAYYLSASNGTLTVSVAKQAANANGELDDTTLKLSNVTYNLGSGDSAATLSSDGTSFTLPQPSRGNNGPFQLMGLKYTADGDVGSVSTLVPIRLK
jgi:hypothetical protein